ncbi:MAG: tRNA (guanosine(46)-N7)-methyltransferase TrmB [Lachnoclostridium sp.]|nr:tRNA (guanosine(46)-N7)-methyltransferase TrmB [Lachnoclostridium sp.]
MGKNKLKKFAEMETLDCVLQYPFSVLKQTGGCPLRGRWHEDFFNNTAPIVLELGCGKGEYAVGMAVDDPSKNYIGIDIKGARMWTGATRVRDLGLKNVAFLRTSIELLDSFFAPGEVSEIWITFPDPQMKKVNKRLTGTRQLELYRKVLVEDGSIHLKTDSPFLYAYTREMLRVNGITPAADTADLYATPELTAKLPPIKTFYEQQWLDRGLTIKFLSFPLHSEPTLVEPEVEFEPDPYRSFGRGQLQGF